ncbi:MAG: insulinase family protein [Gemmatimonadetes bacterium]|nr:insulinase family protein [Gemmatimonadota bacterium]
MTPTPRAAGARPSVARSLAAAATAFALATPLLAQGGGQGAPTVTARQLPPAPGAPKPFQLAEHRTFTMRNGMKVTLVHYGTVPKAVVTVALETGVVDEPPFGPGLASLTMDLLLEGTVARTAQDISRAAAEMGGSIATSAGAVESEVGGEVLSVNAARFVNLVSDVVRHPRFEKGDFERVRQNALRNLAITLQQSGDLARQRWRAVVFPGHPFGRPYSTEATLKALTMGHARNFFDDNFGASRAHLYVSGVFDDAAVEKAARDAFTDWEPGSPAKDRPAAGATVRQVDLVDRPDAPQSTIWIGKPVIGPTNPDFTKLEVTDALLGGAFGSRITSNIREDKGYTYSPYSTLWNHRGAAYWVEVADVTTKDTGNSLKEIVGEIERLRQTPPPDAELDGIKQSVIGLFVIQNSSRRGVVSQLEYMDEQHLGEDYLTGFVQRVLAVTPADVRRMADEQLDPARMTITVVGDRKTVEPQIAPFRPVVP